MNLVDRAVLLINPSSGLRRIQARRAADVLMNYDAASNRSRNSTLKRPATDADAAAWGQRRVLSWVARDLVRNTPFARRAQQVISGNVVGTGILPKIEAKSERLQRDFTAKVKAHCDTTDIDALGRLNLAGIQALVMNTVVDSGECLVRIRNRTLADGLALPFQLEVLEPDYLDDMRDGAFDGYTIRDGIQYDLLGRRMGYWLFREHPGSNDRALRLTLESRFVPADQVLHVFRQDRPGQRRGVSWFAPVAMALRDLHDYEEAHLVRQKLAACFAAFVTSPEDAPGLTTSVGLDEDSQSLDSIMPGRVEYLRPGEGVSFANPPGVDGFDEFTRGMLRGIAAAMGITFEALTGDFSQVNFTSGRMGHQEMMRNVEVWQWVMMIPQFLTPLGRVLIDNYRLVTMNARADVSLSWVPPVRFMVDPAREWPARAAAVAAGMASLSQQIRETGYDPEETMRELKADTDLARQMGLELTSLPATKAKPQAPGAANG